VVVGEMVTCARAEVGGRRFESPQLQLFFYLINEVVGSNLHSYNFFFYPINTSTPGWRNRD